MNGKILYLLRGLPGAGKSTLAKSIGAIYFEADMFFMEGNEYKFNPLKLKDAHAWCQNQVRISMKNANGEPANVNMFEVRPNNRNLPLTKVMVTKSKLSSLGGLKKVFYNMAKSI